MSNEFIVKNGLIVGGNVVTSGTITINGALAATQSWVASQGYLTSASLSGYATQSYVTSAISSLIDAAPAALDTLNELAAALGDDASFSTTITNSIASKLSLTGGTLTGALNGTSATFAGDLIINADNTFFTIDASGNKRLGFTKKFGFTPKLTFGSGNNFVVAVSSAAGIEAANTFTDLLTITPAGATTLTGALTGTSATFSGAVSVGNLRAGITNTIGWTGQGGFESITDGNFRLYNEGRNTYGNLTLGAATLSGTLTGTSATFNGDLTLSANSSYININRISTAADGLLVYKTGGSNRWLLGAWGNSNNTFYLYSYGVGGSVFSVDYSTGIATFSNNLITTNGIADPGYVRITNPEGGVSVGNSPITASIKIALPANGSFTNIMLSFTVHIYDYALGKTRTLKIAGYTYYNQDWYNMSVYQSGGELIGNINVRFGVEGGRNCVWIGETSTYWSYPNVFVTDVQCGHSQTANLTSGWNISFVTTLGTVQNTIVAYTNITTKDIGGTTNYVSKFTGATTLGNSLIFDNGTNVGIGTTSPGSKLHVISNENSDAAGAIRTTALNLTQYADYSFGGITSSYFYRIVSGTNQHISLMPGGTGNVGIGTTSPSQKLHVVGGALRVDNVGTQLALGTNGVAGAYEITTLTSNDLTIALSGVGERMRISSSGNVGIGTTSPDTPLVVQGGSAGTGGWNRTATLSATYPGLIFNSNGTKWGGMAYDYSAAMRFWVNANNDDIFAGTLAMSILNNGNVGIGTSDPIYKLQVAGSAYVNGGTLFIDSGQYLRWGNSNQGIVGVNDSHVAIVSGGATRQTVYAEGRTYFPGLDLSISNINGSHGSGTYFRGDGSHFVFGLSDGNTLYLNYGNSSGILRTFGTWYHESTQILSTSRVLTNVSGNISMFTNNAGYLTSETDTLASVTARGASTSTNITFNGNITANSSIIQGYGTILTGYNAGFQITVNATYSGGQTNTYTPQYAGGASAGMFVMKQRNGGEGIMDFYGKQSGTDGSTQAYSTFNHLMTMLPTGNVGIGNTNPSFKLHVEGDSYVNGVLRISNANPLYFNDYGGGWYMADSSWVRTYNAKSVWVGGGLLGGDGGLTIGYGGTGSPSGGAIIAGTVGIGTSSPGYKLDVQGSAGNITINTNGALSAGGQFISGTGEFASSSSGTDLNFRAGATHLMVLKTSGNVGIGTVSPSSKLEVQGAADTSIQAIFQSSSVGNAAYSGGIQLGNAAANQRSSIVHDSSGDNTLTFTSHYSSGSANKFIFAPGGTERVRFQQNGNVGIGMSPASNERFSVNAAEGIWALSAYRSGVQIGGIHLNDSILNIQGAGGSEVRLSTTGNATWNGDILATRAWVGSQGYLTSVSDIWVNTTGDTMTGTLSFAQPVGLSFANGQYIKDNNSGGLIIYSGAAVGITGTSIAVTGAATFSSSLTVGSRLALQPSNFGYSSGYKTLLIGSAGTDYTTNAVSLAFNVDISGNPSGSFTGNGYEYIWRNTGAFITPNAANTTYNTLFTWNSSGQLTFPAALTVDTDILTRTKLQISNGRLFELIGSSTALNIYDASAGASRIYITSVGKVGIGTTAPAEEFHVLGRAIFDGGSGDSSTDAVVYVTKSNNNDWGLYVNAAALDYAMYARVSPSAGYALTIHNGTTWTTRITGNAVIYLGEKNAIEGNYDTWLRLNNQNHYASGVYTPGVMRADGGFNVSGSTVWHAGNDGSGSGLDADLLDGQNSTEFLRLLSGGAEASLDSYTDNGIRSVNFTGHSQHLLSWNAGGSTGTVQQLFHYGTANNGWRIRNKTDNSSWSDWGYVVMASSNQGLISGTIATQSWVGSQSYATTSYVTTQINNLINGAPGALDTLNELATALGNDASFSTTVTNSIAGKVSKAGDTITGKITFPPAVANRPQFPGGILGLDVGDGNFDIWGISRDYYPSHPTPSNAYGLRWNGDNNDFEFVGAGANRVVLDMDAGNLTIAGFLTESSSLKLKENVETSEGNLEKVVNLRPVTYNKIGSQTKELGLIAEEVATVYPEFVQYDESGEPVGVNYSRLTAALIGAVKELTQRIETLENNG